jgi:hypothetical protein
MGRLSRTVLAIGALLTISGVVVHAQLTNAGEATLLTRGQMERALGGADCNHNYSDPYACSETGEGGQASCPNGAGVICSRGTDGKCYVLTKTGNHKCLYAKASNKHCTETTSGQCGSYSTGLVDPDFVCQDQCTNGPHPCGAPYKSTTVTPCS